MSIFLQLQHVQARIPRAVVTGVLVIKSRPCADLQGMDLIPDTLYIQGHALHDPEEVTRSWFMKRDLRDVVGAEAGAEVEVRL
jgi:hypothetical protein